MYKDEHVCQNAKLTRSNHARDMQVIVTNRRLKTTTGYLCAERAASIQEMPSMTSYIHIIGTDDHCSFNPSSISLPACDTFWLRPFALPIFRQANILVDPIEDNSMPNKTVLLIKYPVILVRES